MGEPEVITISDDEPESPRAEAQQHEVEEEEDDVIWVKDKIFEKNGEEKVSDGGDSEEAADLNETITLSDGENDDEPQEDEDEPQEDEDEQPLNLNFAVLTGVEEVDDDTILVEEEKEVEKDEDGVEVIEDDDDVEVNENDDDVEVIENDDDKDYVPDSDDEKDRLRRSSSSAPHRSVSRNSEDDVNEHPLDDNKTKNFKTRIDNYNSLDIKPDWTVTRMVTSDEYGDSQLPWKVDTVVWNRLHSFQQEGVRWLQRQMDHRCGGILADQMGLGKTIQAVVFLRSIAETGRRHYKSKGLDKALIVCHVSIIAQWIQALHEWFPRARVFLLHSSCSTKSDEDFHFKIFRKLENPSVECPDGAIVLISYSMFTRYKELICKEFWQVVMLDEGHHIRNENTKCSQAMRMLKSTQRYILSGTPFQNRLAEFWKLVDFVHPGRLSDSSTFQRNFVQIINAGANLRCSPQAAAKAYECLVALHRAVKPLILRRLQEDFKDELKLPEKDDKVLYCELTDRQRRLYEQYLNSNQVVQILEKKLLSFVGLQKLADICNHPGIYRGAEPGQSRFGSLEDSGKLATTFKLLREWLKDSANRVIIFTQKHNVVKMMRFFLEKKRIPFVWFTGSTSAHARQETIKSFKEDLTLKVLLMTTRAGGLGLNLTCANKVIIYDPDWNPAADNQAKDRIYRMGQNQRVSIVRLVSNGTIEDCIYMKQRQKELTGMQVLHSSDIQHTIPNNTLKDLFRLKPKGVSGSEVGLYLPGEIARDGTSNGSGDSSEEKKKQRKQMKNKLEGFEDRKLLLALFDDDKISAMRDHSLSVQKNAGSMNRIERIEMATAVKNAVDSLLHTEGRLTHTWKQVFHNAIRPGSTGGVKPSCDYYVEQEKTDSYWNMVHKGVRVNDDHRELNRLVELAKKFTDYMNGVPSTSEKKLFKLFLRDHDRQNAIQMSFVHEVLSTIGKYNQDTKEWSIRPMYRGVEFKPNNKREASPPLLPPKRTQIITLDGSSEGPSTSTNPPKSHSRSSSKPPK